MQLHGDSTKALFQQIAEIIEDQILSGILLVDEQVYSTNQLSKLYNINPATARKGLNLLVDEKIIYKKRGLGMFVSEGAVDYIKNKRKNNFYDDYIVKLLKEGEKLHISKDEIIDMIKKYRGGCINEH
ncbi:MAG: GntR family transcriptional regulator [Vallitalea sp.]|nr:GntR family transcriptional regulator [Vallitalea sp.]